MSLLSIRTDDRIKRNVIGFTDGHREKGRSARLSVNKDVEIAVDRRKATAITYGESETWLNNISHLDWSDCHGLLSMPWALHNQPPRQQSHQRTARSLVATIGRWDGRPAIQCDYRAENSDHYHA